MFPVFIHRSDSFEETKSYSHPIVEMQHFQEGAEITSYITGVLNSE